MHPFREVWLAAALNRKWHTIGDLYTKRVAAPLLTSTGSLFDDLLRFYEADPINSIRHEARGQQRGNQSTQSTAIVVSQS